jgi:hypothetical protein
VWKDRKGKDTTYSSHPKPRHVQIECSVKPSITSCEKKLASGNNRMESKVGMVPGKGKDKRAT